MSSKAAPTRSFTTIEAEAERLAVNPRTLRRMIARGELTAYRFGDRMIRLDSHEVDAMLRPIPTGVGAA